MRLLVAVLLSLAAAAPVSSQTKPTVRVGYIPSDSFAALYIMADRHLPAAGIGVETVRLAGGTEILSQVATGQLHVGGTGMGAAGFNAVASSLPVEFVAPLHLGYAEDYFTVRKASWEKEVKRIADLKGKPVALNVRGAAVEWMLRPGSQEGRANSARCTGQDHAVPRHGAGARDRRGRGCHPDRAVSDPGRGARGGPTAPTPAGGGEGHADHRHLLEQGMGHQGARVGPQSDAGLSQGGPRPRAGQRLEAGAQHRSDGQVHRRQGRRHSPRPRARARPEPRYGSRGPRVDAAPERRDGVPEIQGPAAGLAPLQLRLPQPGGGGARQEVAWPSAFSARAAWGRGRRAASRRRG